MSEFAPSTEMSPDVPEEVPAVVQVEQLAVSRIFSSTPDETRVRRAADVGTVVLSALVLFLAAWVVDDGTGPKRWFARVVGGAR